MRRPQPSRKELLLALAVTAAAAVLVVALLSLTHQEPKLAPAATPTSTSSTTASTESTSSLPSTSTTAPGATAPGRMVPLPAKTSVVATTTATEGEIEVFDSATATEARQSLPVKGEYGQQQVFLVLQSDEAAGRHEVLLPVRPNGSKGWIDDDDVTLTSHDVQIQVSLSEFRMLVQKGDEVVVDTPVGVGTSDTPTVGGQYYTWVLIDPTNAGYGSYAFGLSGFSTLESFNGGDGRLGIHGDTNPSSFGRAVSHGCVRVPDDQIVDMVETLRLPLGVPVTIVA